MTSELDDRSLLRVRVKVRVGGHGGKNEAMIIMSCLVMVKIEGVPPKTCAVYPLTSFVVWEVTV
jgi:hypothetical protein